MRSAARRILDGWDTPHFLRCLVAGAAVAFVFWLLKNPGAPLVRAVDALFFGGLAIFLYGVCRSIARLGFFDLPAFAFRKVRQTLRGAKQGEDDETVPKERLTTYADYLTRPHPRPSCAEALCAGGAYLALCAALLLFL